MSMMDYKEPFGNVTFQTRGRGEVLNSEGIEMLKFLLNNQKMAARKAINRGKYSWIKILPKF